MNQRRAINHKTYSSYLNEHYLGSEGGINAFKAAAGTWKGTAHEHGFNSLCQQVMADRDDLHRIMTSLGYRPQPFKHLLTHLVRLLGRFNPVNILRRRRTGLSQVELEVLTGMLRAKQAMWETLLLVSAKDPRLDAPLLRKLHERATNQIDQVRSIIQETWEERFLEDKVR